jgi:hypothetical protein
MKPGCRRDGDSKGRDRSPGEGWGLKLRGWLSLFISVYLLWYPRLSPSIPHSIPFLNISEIYLSEIQINSERINEYDHHKGGGVEILRYWAFTAILALSAICYTSYVGLPSKKSAPDKKVL